MVWRRFFFVTNLHRPLGGQEGPVPCLPELWLREELTELGNEEDPTAAV